LPFFVGQARYFCFNKKQKYMNTLKTSLFAILLMALVFTSCKKDEPITIDATDYAAAFAGATVAAWTNGSVIGTVNATTNNGNLNYTLVSQNIAGIIAINATTGQITVENKSAFNTWATICVPNSPTYDGRITAVARLTNGSVTRDINVTINLTGWCD
jgi:hypothetical protein